MAWINILQAVYPVGSVYISTTATSPASVIGGTWEQKKNGCLACAGTSGYAAGGATGGSSTIKEANLPKMSGQLIFRNVSGDANIVRGATGVFSRDNTETWSGTHGIVVSENYSNPKNMYVYFDYGGGGAYYPAHLSLYVWVRTA